MRFHVKVDGVTQTMAAFLAVQRGIVDMRQLGTWDMVQAIFYKIMRRQFESEGGAGRSGKWKPITTKYAKIKFRKYKSVRILRASDRLFKSLTSQSGDAVVDKQPQELTIGTRLEYAKYHQTGTSRMPARPPFDMTADDERQMTEPLTRKVRQLIQNARLRDKRSR